MIQLQPVTKENLDEVLCLRINEDQAGFVSTTATAFPFAVYSDQEVVGFIMMGFYEAKNYYTLWKLLIDRDHQHKGCGRKALELGIAFLKDCFDAREIYTGVIPGNDAAKKLYESMGFRETGLFENGMLEMRLSC